MVAMNKVVLKIDFIDDEIVNFKYLQNYIFMKRLQGFDV